MKLILSRILSLIIQRRLFGLSDGTYQSAGALRGNLLKLNPTKCAEYSADKYPQSPVSEWWLNGTKSKIKSFKMTDKWMWSIGDPHKIWQLMINHFMYHVNFIATFAKIKILHIEQSGLRNTLPIEMMRFSFKINKFPLSLSSTIYRLLSTLLKRNSDSFNIIRESWHCIAIVMSSSSRAVTDYVLDGGI